MINRTQNLNLSSFSLTFEALRNEGLDSVQVASTRKVDDEVHGTSKDEAEVIEAGGT